MNMQEFQMLCEAKNISISEHQLNQLSRYAQLLQEWNEKINLTAITGLEDIFIKHFYDSLLIAPYCYEAKMLCDVGSGAGFPGLVLKIVLPEVNITLVEPTLKRVNFLNLVISELNLEKISVLNKRMEDCIELKESFDIVTARAVAALRVLSELCLPFVRVNGFFIAMKGSSGQEELEVSKNALKVLGGNVSSVIKETLPDGSARMNILIQKVSISPSKYPRAYAQIKKKAL
ncbi:MAG: 16S rRNA (guanine(527)-N(7))-methyltransferase RsmG [Erysipelotrichaceae bacterium]|nr:16S rRNA (guanine(527)-N(7))-methyltransferase RsmG [Erysipelotrichaceae bacterium]MDP3305692.1 16S rRNA (guanine(527)-N(7))-methyltransferase RsmG [Erysipelotrichaceae bacterium]